MDTKFAPAAPPEEALARRYPTNAHPANPAPLSVLASALGVTTAAVIDGLQSQQLGCQRSLRSTVKALLRGDLCLTGVGPARVARLEAALALARWLAWEDIAESPCLNSPDACTSYLRQHFALYQREVFCCLFLDSRNRLLACRDLFAGTIDAAAVYPREVVAEALRLGANGIIAAHNHPSGHVAPSSADARITERLREALALLDIRLLDHIIVGHGAVHSMAAHGEAGF